MDRGTIKKTVSALMLQHTDGPLSPHLLIVEDGTLSLVHKTPRDAKEPKILPMRRDWMEYGMTTTEWERVTDFVLAAYGKETYDETPAVPDPG